MTKFFRVALILLTMLIISPAIVFSEGRLEQRIDDLSQQISKEMTDYQKTTIAVIEFADLRGNVSDFGRFLSEELITRLYQTKKFKVIERQLLSKIITEQKLNLTDMINPDSARQLGKLLGVEAIASGTVTDLAQSLRVNARLISTETGEIFAVASTEIFKDESVIKLMGSGTKSTDSSASKLETKSGDGITPGMSFQFQDQVFEINDIFRVSLVSIEFMDKNRPKVNMIIENLTNYTQRYMLTKPQQFSYINDQSADTYIFKEASHISYKEETQIPPGIPTKFSMTFAEVPPSVQNVSVILRLYYSAKYKNYDITFKNLSLHN